MEGWKFWEGKKVFIILKNKRTYQGEVLEIEMNPNSPLVWIIIKDKFGKRVQFVNSEVDIIQEEGE